MGALLNLELGFDRIECGECGTHFWVSSHFRSALVESKRTFYCPNGHPRAYQKSEADRLREELDKQKKRTAWAEEQAKNARAEAERAELRRRAQFGENTKLRNRLAKGVCPCCRRNFSNLGRHLRNQHPDFAQPQE